MNKVIITGNIGQDPVIAEKSGRRFSTFSIAHTEKWTNKTTGAKEERTEWFSVIASGDGLIDKVIVPYFKRGTRLLVEGKLRCRKVDDKTYYSIELEHFELMGSSKNTASTAPAAASVAAPAPAPKVEVPTVHFDEHDFDNIAF